MTLHVSSTEKAVKEKIKGTCKKKHNNSETSNLTTVYKGMSDMHPQDITRHNCFSSKILVKCA